MRKVLRWSGIVLGLIVGLPVLALGILALALAATGGPHVQAAPGPAVGGVFHVHTTASHDGYGTLQEAVDAARQTGNRFVVVTEHNVVQPTEPVWMDGVLVVPGVEISAKAGHVIALGLDRPPNREERGPEVLDWIRAQGGLAIPAHPINRRRPWDDPSPDGFAGFEVLSLDSAFRDAQKEAPWRLATALAALVGAREKMGALLVERPDAAFDRYDELTARRDVALMCGADAHGLPPYPGSYGAMRLHFVPPAGFGGDAAADAAALLQAIEQARTFCSIPTLGDASSFHFGSSRGVVTAGIDADGVIVRLFHDGREVARGPGPQVQAPAAAGVWRAEVLVDDPGFPFRKQALWIASSALRL